MERLSIDEVIEHCKRHTERMENHSGRMQLEETPIGNSNIMKQYWEHRQVAEWLEQLKSYKDAEEQGLLLRLPCKVGDVVWYVDDDDNYPLEFLVTKIDIEENNYFCYHAIEKKDCGKIGFIKDDINKTVFLTQEEAEQALKQMGE